MLNGGASGVGTAVETARSSAPAIWSQKHGPSAGDAGWWPAVWCAAWWRHTSTSRTVSPPGPAASQQAAASVKSIDLGALRIVSSVRWAFRLAQPWPGRV